MYIFYCLFAEIPFTMQDDPDGDIVRQGIDAPERIRAALVTGSSSGIGAVTAEDVAAAVVFLASPLAGYLNGATLRVDGGLTGSVNP